MTEHEVKGKTYYVGKLPAMQQLHVSKRLTPLLAALAPMLPALMGAKSPAAQLEALTPFAKAFAALPDADAEYIVMTCLGIVSRDMEGKGKTRGPLYKGGVSCCDDLGLDVILPLVIFVVKQSLGPFIDDFLTSAPVMEVTGTVGA